MCDVFSYLCYNVSVPFNVDDALNLESLLTEDEILLKNSFRSYCQQKLMPRIMEANRKEGVLSFFR